MDDNISETVEVAVESKTGKLIPFKVPMTEFKVFLDEETCETAELLNKIRQTAPAEVVIKAVALVRGLQVGASYARKYAPHLRFEVEDCLTKILSDTCGKYLAP